MGNSIVIEKLVLSGTWTGELPILSPDVRTFGPTRQDKTSTIIYHRYQLTSPVSESSCTPGSSTKLLKLLPDFDLDNENLKIFNNMENSSS